MCLERTYRSCARQRRCQLTSARNNGDVSLLHLDLADGRRDFGGGLRRSIVTISRSACLSACAAAIPEKPPPTITTRFRSGRGTSTTTGVHRAECRLASRSFDHLCSRCQSFMVSATLPFRNSPLNAPAIRVCSRLSAQGPSSRSRVCATLRSDPSFPDRFQAAFPR
jgi:hypothetical protein